MSHTNTFLTAIERNHIQFIPTWLNTFGVDVNCCNSVGDTGLIIAARNGFFDMVKLLVRNKANINQANNKGETALFAAAQAGHVKIFIYLVQSGGNLRLKDKKGRTAVTYFTKTSLEYLISECKALNLVRVLNLFKTIPQGTFPSFAQGISTFKRKTTETEKETQDGFSQIKEAFEKIQQTRESTKSEELRKIQSYLEQNNYRDAEKLLNTAKYVSQKEYVSLRHRYLLEFLKNDTDLDQPSIDFILKNLDKNGQDVYLDALCSDLSEDELKQIRSIIPIKFDDDIRVMETYINCLEKMDFLSVDEQFREKKNISSEIYKKLKAIYIKKYVNSIKQKVNGEQAEAIADITPNILVTARAGSGKTTTVINKVILEIKKYGLSPESIQILAFNKKAAEEVNDRLKKFDKKLPCLASTFHSLAWHFYNGLTGTAPNLIDKEDSSEERIALIGKAMDESYQKHIEDFYDNIRLHLSIRDNREIYGLILMKKKELPLEQKYMADLLFENEFSFKGTIIEFGLRCRLFKSEYADFYAEIDGKKVLFVKFNSGKSIAEEFKTNPKSWARKTGKLIEFSAAIDRERIKDFLARNDDKTKKISEDIFQERINFENSFLEVLKANGIVCIGKKDRGALIKQVAKTYKGLAQQLYETLVSKYQQKQWKIKEISSHIEDYCKSNPVSKNILLLKNSLPVFKKYNDLLKEQQKIDFNILLAETTSMLNVLTHKDIQLNNRQKYVLNEISSLKILLIDEFQDFSPLFFKFIGVIKKINPNIRLFCVGDDWQAINEFAGSNVFFFENFSSEIQKYFDQPSSSCHLLENFRSNQAIVMKANHFMQKFADRKDEAGGKATRGGLPQSSVIRCPLYSEGIGDTILRIINIELDAETALTKKYLVLARTREGVDEAREAFEAAYVDFSSEYGIDINLYQQLDIQFMTYHKAKGKEAEVCIVVVDENAFPSYHPHAEMIDSIFEGNWRKQAENLFYVTLTRAKDRIFFVGKPDVIWNNRYIKEITEKYKLVSRYKNKEKEIQCAAEEILYWKDEEQQKNTLELVDKIRSLHTEGLFKPSANKQESCMLDLSKHENDLKCFFKDTSRLIGTETNSHLFLHLYKYYPTTHPEHSKDAFSKKLSLWKQNGENAQWFTKQLNDILANDFTILTVPSHTPAKESGLSTLLKDICKKHNIRDASSCLRRTKEIKKLASGGPRAIKTHLSSIELVNSSLLEGCDKILLIDDIKSTGNSLLACEALIKEKCPNSLIYKFTFGETFHQEGI